MTPRNIYIAGPMRGITEYNFPAFLLAGDLLRDQGHIVHNPAEEDMANGFQWENTTGLENLTELGFDHRAAVARGLKWIARYADTVVVLDGWQDSLGARAEVAAAVAIDIPVHHIDHIRRWGIDDAVDLTKPMPEAIEHLDTHGYFTHAELCQIASWATAKHLQDDTEQWLLWEDWPWLTQDDFDHLDAIVRVVGQQMQAAANIVDRAVVNMAKGRAA